MNTTDPDPLPVLIELIEKTVIALVEKGVLVVDCPHHIHKGSLGQVHSTVTRPVRIIKKDSPELHDK